MSAPVFSFDNISGGYGQMTIVRDVSAAVSGGRCLCILGRNGVGKSTLLKLLSGHLACTSGTITLDSVKLDGLLPDRRHRFGLSYAMQERPVFDNLSVRDNLVLMQNSGSLDAYDPYFEAFAILKNRLSQVAGTLSGGERKILSFVRTMAEPAKVHLLDEPSEGVQPENIEHMRRFIDAAKAKGRCLVVVEQHLHLAEAIADSILIMDQGTCVLQGPASDIGRDKILHHLQV